MTKLTQKRDLRFISATVFLTLVVIAGSSTVQASCWVPDVNDGYKIARAVFIGEVEAIIPPPNSDPAKEFFFALVKFKIEKSWKGFPFDTVTVNVTQGQAFSALPPMHKGERYLVYADTLFRENVKTDELLVSSCNRTALLPLKTSPQPSFIMDSGFDRNNGTRDLRALDSLMFLEGW